MEEWKILLLSAGLSFFSAIVSSKITSNLAQKNEICRAIREKRYELYSNLYAHIDQILTNRQLIFSDEYWETIVKFKASMKLFSSKETFDAFHQYFSFIAQQKKAFEQYCSKNDPQNDLENHIPYTDDFGYEQEVLSLMPGDVEEYERLCSSYKFNHQPSADMVNKHLIPLYENMRKDIGSDM